MTDDGLLKAAGKVMPGFDYIINLYDLSMEYFSEHALKVGEVTRKQAEGLSARDLLAGDESKKSEMVYDSIESHKRDGTYKFVTLSGKVKFVTLKFKPLEYEKVFYEVGKIVKVEKGK
jgi:hypothetical protein